MLRLISRAPASRRPTRLCRGMDPSHANSNASARVSAPAAERNKIPIADVLAERCLGTGSSGTILEIGAGTGLHSSYFADRFPSLTFQPTDYVDELFPSINAWTSGKSNVNPPVVLDAATEPEAWKESLRFQNPSPLLGVVVVNVTHISPWKVTTGILRGASALLQTGQDAFLAMYGPFLVNGLPTTESNREFDASLRQRNPEWGYRDIAAIDAEARMQNLTLTNTIPMPANNLMLIFRRVESGE